MVAVKEKTASMGAQFEVLDMSTRIGGVDMTKGDNFDKMPVAVVSQRRVAAGQLDAYKADY